MLPELIGAIIGLVIGVPVGAVLLMLASKIFKLADTSYLTALKVVGISGVVAAVLSVIGSFLPPALAILLLAVQGIVGIALSIYLIKTFYDEEWKETLLTWLVWMVFSMILYFVIMMIFGALFMALFLGSMAA